MYLRARCCEAAETQFAFQLTVGVNDPKLVNPNLRGGGDIAVTSRRKILSGTFAVMLTISLEACSSSSKPAATTPTSAAESGGSSTSAHATGAPIKVGVICTCSGTFGAQLSVTEDVYKAWADSVNASGGVNGHPVQLVLEDDGDVPGTSVTDLQTLISDHVDVIADDSNVDESWASAVPKDLPVVGIFNTNLPFQTNPDFYPQGETATSTYTGDVEAAKQAGAANLGILYCAEISACSELVGLFRNISKTVGVPITYTAAISATAPNYTAQCLAAQQDHIKSMFVGDATVVTAKLASNCAQQGYKPTFILPGAIYDQSLLHTPGISDDAYLVYSSLPDWVNAPAVQAMNTAVDKYYPGLRANTTTFTEGAAQAWPAGLLLADAVKAGGLTAGETPSVAEILSGLAALKGDTLEGWAPPLTFTAGQPHLVNCFFLAHIQSGALSIENGGKAICTGNAAP